jgi:hypothetical protein
MGTTLVRGLQNNPTSRLPKTNKSRKRFGRKQRITLCCVVTLMWKEQVLWVRLFGPPGAQAAPSTALTWPGSISSKCLSSIAQILKHPANDLCCAKCNFNKPLQLRKQYLFDCKGQMLETKTELAEVRLVLRFLWGVSIGNHCSINFTRHKDRMGLFQSKDDTSRLLFTVVRLAIRRRSIL